MKICPDCRTPIQSLMFIDKSLVPELYCERCCKAVKEVVERPVSAVPVLA